MKKVLAIIITILVLVSAFNYFTMFSLIFDVEILTFFWLTFYSVVLPIGMANYIFRNYKGKVSFIKMSFYTVLLYLLSCCFSNLYFFDFNSFKMIGDRATNYLISILFLVCVSSSFFGFIFYQIKNRNISK